MKELKDETYDSLSDETLIKKIEKTYEKAETEAEYEKLIEMLSEMIRRDSKSTSFYGVRAQVFNELGRNEDAFMDICKAIQFAPKKAWNYNLRAAIKYELHMFDDDEMIDDYTKAIYWDNKNDIYYCNRGLVLKKANRLAEALEDYDIAIELNPKNPAYYCAYGAALYDLGRFREAVLYYTKAIEIAPDSDLVRYLMYRGNTYRELGQFEKAYADYARGMEIAPENPDLITLCGFAKAKEGDFDAAYADIMKAIQLKPDYSGYYNVLGDVFSMAGRYEEAVDYYTVAIDMESDCSDFYKDRAKAYAALGKTKEAEADTAKAAELESAREGQSVNVEAGKTPKPKKMNKTAEAIIRVLREKAGKKSAKMTFMKQKTRLTDSKLGGVPFIPVGGEYPVNPKTGDKLYLLIQINFAEMPPLPDYPAEGILQIFVSGDDTYGCEYGEGQDSWRTLYYEDISHPMSKEDIIAMMPEYPEGYMDLPITNPENEYRIRFAEADTLISRFDFRFDKMFSELCDDVLPDKLKGKGYYDLPDKVTDDLDDDLSDVSSRIGGYPEILDEDRRGEYIPEEYELLLQVSSDMDNEGEWATMWSDCGFAHFFIDPEDLKKRDFSKVIYTWEGC